jgi:UDPglucose 6-dehydrogenase
MKIGIVGCGFVGSAIKNAYDVAGIETVVRDPNLGYDISYDELKKTDTIFVCVPSPKLETGECDTSILCQVMADLADYDKPIVSKVTAPPNVYRDLFDKYKNFIYSPEFLVAATAKEDYISSKFLILGGDEEVCATVKPLVCVALPEVTEVYNCKIEEASMIKYTINTFLATKVVFMNQLYQLLQFQDIDYDAVVKGVMFDERFGRSHTQVPGTDGQYGFGGACFPKDTDALAYFARNIACSPLTVLEEAININNQIRF